jgi:hypothetical protein
VVGTARRST